GDCVVEADAGEAPEILEVIKEMQLPLMLVFNHSRVMVLPQKVTKASGLRVALETMRLSLHNCISIGDGENDHSLLDACEIGVASAGEARPCTPSSIMCWRAIARRRWLD